MQRYDGELVYCVREGDTLIEVVDSGPFRSLHFGTQPKQSSMIRERPDYLILSYTQAMAAALLLIPPPQRVLMIGLGGGSLLRFIHSHYPDCHVDVVECSEAVCRVAREYFHVQEAPQLHYHIEDAAHFVQQDATQPYDLILVDAFVADGISPAVCSTSFLDQCHALLKAHGVLAMNLWSEQYHGLRMTIKHIARCFQHQYLELEMEGKDNCIILASREAKLKKRLAQLKPKAILLQENTAMNFRWQWKQMVKASKSWL